MAQPSRIEWTEYSWNPVTGCSKLSSGCIHCYAERMAFRLQAMGVKRYKDGFLVRTHPDLLQMPLKWRRPRAVFVNSMSDLFHEDVPESFIEQVFNVMNQCPHHTFQILTKRSKRLVELSRYVRWAQNIWMGVTVEDDQATDRIRDLRKCHSRLKFISFEPLLGPIRNLVLDGIDWVIVGGESGPQARPMEESWAISIRDQCLNEGIPYFFKQWGGWKKKEKGRVLDGRIWDQMPPLVHEQLQDFSRRYFIP